MALLAVAALAHALVTAVRRRRVELAVLKTIGFSRGQLAGTVAWQASVLTLVAVVVGLPVGVAAGRWAWRVFADQLGIVFVPVVPVVVVIALVPAALLLANVVAAVPGYLAARTPAAAVLRSE
jgi:predicted lysophospholipase L1 biosynthesis ABC-type transport system permease subunit